MAITLTGGVGSRGAGEVVQRTTPAGATHLRIEGTFATLGVKSVEARVVVSGGSVEVTNWVPLKLESLGATDFKGVFTPPVVTTHTITAVSATSPMRLTLAGRHMIEQHRTRTVRVVGNGVPGGSLDAEYTATGTGLPLATGGPTILTIPVDNTGSLYVAGGSLQVVREPVVPISRSMTHETTLWYNWQVRTKNQDGTVLETLNSTIDWGVGLVFLVIGQSNAGKFFTLVDAGTRDTADPMISWWNGTTWAKLVTSPAGNGIHRLLNTIQTACEEQQAIMSTALPSQLGNIPVGAIKATADSSALIEGGNWGNGGVWTRKDSGIYNTARTTTTAATDRLNVEGVIWQQGESEAMASMYAFGLPTGTYTADPGDYEQGLIAFYDQLKSADYGFVSPCQEILPFSVSPPARNWAGWINGVTFEVGTGVMQSYWPAVVGDSLEFVHRDGDPDITYNIKSITTNSQTGSDADYHSMTILELDRPHGIKHTAPIRIEAQPALSGVTVIGQWQAELNGSWTAERVSDTSIAIPQPSHNATFVLPVGRVTVERGPAYATTRTDEVGSDALHLTAAGSTTLGDRVARAVARRCGIEGNLRTFSISAITSPTATPVVTFTAAHGLPLGSTFYVYFSGTDSTPVIDGWRRVLVQSTTTVQLITGQITTTVAGTTGLGRVPGKRGVGFSLRGPRVVAAVFGDELTGTVAAEQSRSDITVYVKHERGRTLTYDATSILQSWEVCDEAGPMFVHQLVLGDPALSEGGVQRIVLRVRRDTSSTEAAANYAYFGPDRIQGNYALIRYGQFPSTPYEAPTNIAVMFDDAAGLPLPLLPTFGHLSARLPRGDVPLSPLSGLPTRSRSFIVTTLAATTVTSTAATIAGPEHATEFWRFVGQGARQIRPGDRWFQITAAGLRINEGTIDRVATWTAPAANVVLTLDRAVTTTDGNYLLIANEFDGACAILAYSREFLSQGG